MSAPDTRRRALLAALLIGAVAASVHFASRLDGDPPPTSENPFADGFALVPFDLAEIGAVEVLTRGELHRFERDIAGDWFYHRHRHASAAGPHAHRAEPAEAAAIAAALDRLAAARAAAVVDGSASAEHPELIVMLYRPDRVQPAWRMHVGGLARDARSRYVLLPDVFAVVAVPDDSFGSLIELVAAITATP